MKANLKNIAATTVLAAMAIGTAAAPALAAAPNNINDITFHVYVDTNGNGTRDEGDTAPSDITYTLSTIPVGQGTPKVVSSGSANADGTIHLQDVENGVTSFLTITSGGKSYTYQLDLLHMTNKDYPVSVDVAWSPEAATTPSEFVNFTVVFMEDTDFTSNMSQGDTPAAGRSVTFTQGEVTETVTTDAEGRATVSGKFKAGEDVHVKDNGYEGREFNAHIKDGVNNFVYTVLVPKKRDVPEEKGVRLGLKVFEDTDGDGVISAGDKNITNDSHVIANQNGEDHTIFRTADDGPTSWFKELQPGEVVLTDHPTGTATSVIIPDGAKEFTVNMLVPKKENVQYNGNSSVDVNTTINFREDADGDGIISTDDKPLVGHEIKIDYTGSKNGTVTKTTDDKGAINIPENIRIGSHLVVTDLTTNKTWNTAIPGTVANFKLDVLEPAAKTNKPGTGNDEQKPPAEARKVTTKIVILEDTDKSGNVTEKDKALGGRALKLTINGQQKDVVTGEDGSVTIDDGIKAGDTVAISDTVSGSSWNMSIPKNVSFYTFKALISPKQADQTPDDTPSKPSVRDLPVKTTIHIVHDTDKSGNVSTGDRMFANEEVKIVVDGVEKSYKTDIGGRVIDNFKQDQKIKVIHPFSGRSWDVEVPGGVDSFDFDALVPDDFGPGPSDSATRPDLDPSTQSGGNSSSGDTSNGTDTSNGNSATGESTGDSGVNGRSKNEFLGSLAHTGTNAASVGAVLAITLTAAGATIALKRRKAS